ncbi:unnamed protein product [Citrullus colocynthis]|uniref:Uncharacterized protein n=1 Tax=Citrullus colocynthis TaxID=252529 RepID=A0ABP0Z1E4_9ROSI
MSVIFSILSLFAPSSAFGLSQESQRSLSPEMIPRKLRTVFTGAAVILGGICTLNFASFLTIQTLRLTAEAKRRKIALPCKACRGKGFYICKLCRGNAVIQWSPLSDPIAMNPCVCPTCDGNRVQRCLNCLGKGYEVVALSCNDFRSQSSCNRMERTTAFVMNAKIRSCSNKQQRQQWTTEILSPDTLVEHGDIDIISPVGDGLPTLSFEKTSDFAALVLLRWEGGRSKWKLFRMLRYTSSYFTEYGLPALNIEHVEPVLVVQEPLHSFSFWYKFRQNSAYRRSNGVSCS